MRLASRRTKYISLDGGTNITTPVVEIPEGDFIYTYNMEPSKTKGLNSSRGYERVDGNATDPSKVILHIYTYEALTGTLPVQGDSITQGLDIYTVCGVVQLSPTTGHIYLHTEVSPAPEVSAFVTNDGGFVTNNYRFIQRIKGSKFSPKLLSDAERPFYNYCIEQQRLLIQPVPGVGPVLGVAQDPNNSNYLAIRNDGVKDVLYEAVPGSGWTIVAGTVLTSSTHYQFKEITQGLTNRRIYFANGVDSLHYYDSTVGTAGTVITTIAGIILKPEFVEQHMDRVVCAAQNYVFLSARETPDFTINAFALETNFLITGLSRLVNNGLLVTTEKSLYILDGSPDPSSPAFGTFKEISTQTGALQDTVDSADTPYFINRYGISTLSDTNRAGRFEANPLSDKVLPIVSNRYDIDGLPVDYVGASIDREKNLYRVYRSDGLSFCMLVTHRRAISRTSTEQANNQRFFPITFNDYLVGLQCTGEGIDYDGEFLLAGSGYDTNFATAADPNYSGFIYKMETGFSLDGRAIMHSIKTSYLHFGGPAINKRYFKFSITTIAPEKVAITYKADYNLGDSRFSEQLDIATISGLSRFNQSGFDSATWSSNFVSEVGGYLNGSGTNISLNLNAETLNTEDFTIQGIVYHYIPRGLKR